MLFYTVYIVTRQCLLRIYALSCEKFLGLHLWMCKKCENILFFGNFWLELLKHKSLFFWKLLTNPTQTHFLHFLLLWKLLTKPTKKTFPAFPSSLASSSVHFSSSMWIEDSSLTVDFYIFPENRSLCTDLNFLSTVQPSAARLLDFVLRAL